VFLLYGKKSEFTLYTTAHILKLDVHSSEWFHHDETLYWIDLGIRIETKDLAIGGIIGQTTSHKFNIEDLKEIDYIEQSLTDYSSTKNEYQHKDLCVLAKDSSLRYSFVEKQATLSINTK